MRPRHLGTAPRNTSRQTRIAFRVVDAPRKPFICREGGSRSGRIRSAVLGPGRSGLRPCIPLSGIPGTIHFLDRARLAGQDCPRQTSVTPSFVRSAHATPTNEPLEAIEAFAFARPVTPISMAVPLRVSTEPPAPSHSRTAVAIPINVKCVFTKLSSLRFRTRLARRTAACADHQRPSRY